VTAKAGTGAKAPPEPVRPKDLSHIRVGPPFDSKIDAKCPLCEGSTLGKKVAIVENTRTRGKRAAHEDCIQRPENADLLARRSNAGTFSDFLA